MRINHNISAINANRQLSSNQGATSKSLQKLSSGLRINTAGDDAAGLAISEKMRSQIRGLAKAQSNAQDSISLIQTAEGALQQVSDILQRMRELAVQSMNGILSETEKESIGSEMTQLRQEVDRIAQTSKFNNTYLLKGTLGMASDTDSTKSNIYKAEGGLIDNVLAVDIAAAEKNTTYTIEYKHDDAKAEEPAVTAPVYEAYTSTEWASVTGKTLAGVVGAEDVPNAKLLALDTATANGKIKDTDGTTELDSPNNEGIWVVETGASTGIYKKTLDKNATGAFYVVQKAIKDLNVPLVKTAHTSETNKAAVASAGSYIVATAETVETEAAKPAEPAKTYLEISYKVGNDENADEKKATCLISDEQKESYTGFLLFTGMEDDNAIDAGIKIQVEKMDLTTWAGNGGRKTITTTDGGKTDLQIGANSEDTPLKIEIPDLRSGKNGLGLESLKVTTTADAKQTLNYIDGALTKLNKARGNLGAYQNRLEYTINSLSASEENLTAAESRIRDVDMAREMVAYTQANILNQSATAMLTQANQQPQQVLQLLQGL